MYNVVITVYVFVLRVISPFSLKVKLMINGQKETFNILKEKIDMKAKYIWFHAASLGEFEQGRPLIEKLRRKNPNCKILLTFFSPSGYEVRKNYTEVDIVAYLPFDLKRNVKWFLNLVPLSAVIFIKYEFWMNYLTELKIRNIPTYIISALFQDTQLFFRWYGKKYRKCLEQYTHLFVQDEHSKTLLSQYGIYNVSVCGDTRLDRVYTVYQQRKKLPLVERFIQGKNNVLVAGSTWTADEKVIIPYFNQTDNFHLIIAPHEIHKGHIQTIVSQLKKSYTLYSEATEDIIEQTDCLIIDCFGLLSSIYRYGKIAYVGGGFGAGIHNVLEAAVYGIPVLFGTNHQRFKEAKDLIREGGGIVVGNSNEFNSKINELCTYPLLQKEIGEKAKKYVFTYKGATEIILQRVINSIIHRIT